MTTPPTTRPKHPLTRVLLSLFLLSSALAAAPAPLLGSTTSLMTSSFCSKWRCTYLSTDRSDPARSTVVYHYRLQGGSELLVQRSATTGRADWMSVTWRADAAANLLNLKTTGQKTAAAHLGDLTLLATGQRSTLDLAGECLKTTPPGRILSSRVHPAGAFSVACASTTENGQPVITVTFGQMDASTHRDRTRES